VDAAMHDGVGKIVVDQEVLLLARFGTVPSEIQRPEQARLLLRRLVAVPTAMHQLRTYWANQFSAHALNHLADHDVVRIIDGAIQSGQLQALVLPAEIAEAKLLTRTSSPAPPAPPLPSSPNLTPTQTRPIVQWSLAERVVEISRRAVPKVPGDIGAALLSLVSPENLAIVVGTIGFSAAANLTPYGWAADAVIVGVAFGFGGVAAIHALGDLVECFKRTIAAKSVQDLDVAADALARAAVGLGVVGLMAVLHRVAAREGGEGGGTKAGGAGQQMTERELAAARAERLKARLKASQEKAKADQQAAAQPRPKSLREKYMGRTPGKKSRTGREVIARMEKEGKIQTNAETGAKEFLASDGQWYDLSKADMSHKIDAVTWWNKVGRSYGAKSPEVRAWMLDSNNYELRHYSINRSEGAKLGQTEQYQAPLR
jgi:hypothetical protein